MRKGGSYGLVNLRGITAHLREERKVTEVGHYTATTSGSQVEEATGDASRALKA